ncbi:MAG: PD-(D/E)XK nuclease family protein [Parahaliea sp.]
MTAQQFGPRYDITELIPLIAQGSKVLTANSRLARLISSQWDSYQREQGRRAWHKPVIQPLEAWLLAQWRERCLDDALLRRVLLESGPERWLWRQVIEQDMNEQASYNLLHLDAAAELAQQARNHLLRADQSLADQTLAACFETDTDCSSFLRWARKFEHLLTEQGQVTPLDALHLLADRPGTARGHALLVDFDEVTPLFQRALDGLCESVSELPIPEAIATTELRAYSDPYRELQGVARWARQCHETEPQSVIGIVLGDMRADRTRLEYLLRREFDCLASHYNSLPVNFSTGWPLAEVPVVRDALLALSVSGRSLGGQTINKLPSDEQKTVIEDVLALLRSRFLALPDRYDISSRHFLRALYRLGQDPVSTASLRNLAGIDGPAGPQGTRLGEILLLLFQDRQLQQKAMPTVWAQRFGELLLHWGWPGGGLDSLEYQQVQEWHKVLAALSDYDNICGQINFSQALTMLSRHCAGVAFQPQTDNSRLQVLGPLEAAGLSFDHLWLFGMQAGQWPAPARPNPFIPLPVQRQLAMPHASAEREWDFARHLFKRYHSAAPRLYASYSCEIDGAPELPSDFVRNFRLMETEPVDMLSGHWRKQYIERDLEYVDDHCAPTMSAQELTRVRGGSGLIEDQANCPFRAFARRRLHIESLPVAGLGLSASERGSLLHAALFTVWGELDDTAALHSLTSSAEAALIGRAVAAAIATLPLARRTVLGRACIEQQAEHLQQLLQQWLVLEREREPFSINAREIQVKLALGSLSLTLQADRIDQLEDGSRVIIDYKSRAGSISDWLGERPASPQLPLYSLADEEAAQMSPLAALAFAQVKPRNCLFKGLGDRLVARGIVSEFKQSLIEKSGCNSWPQLRAAWRENLQQLADDFVMGRASVDPLKNSCQWCDLQPLCRIGAVDADRESTTVPTISSPTGEEGA